MVLRPDPSQLRYMDCGEKQPVQQKKKQAVMMPYFKVKKRVVVSVLYRTRTPETPHHYLFGHRHLPIRMNVDGASEYINLGDWIQYFTYVRMDEKPLLKAHKGDVRTDPEAEAFTKPFLKGLSLCYICSHD